MHALRRCILAAGVAGLIAGAAGADDNKIVAPPGAETLSVDQYYGDSVSRIGSFPGKLICVPKRDLRVPENATDCGDDKVYALAMEQPTLVLPLIATNGPLDGQLKRLTDEKVVVRGKHYPEVGMIGVSSIESTSIAGDAPQ